MENMEINENVKLSLNLWMADNVTFVIATIIVGSFEYDDLICILYFEFNCRICW